MMRKRLTMVALLALALLLVPVRAYADFSLDPFGNGNIWTGRVNDTNFGAFTRANDIYDAAVYAIGQDPITLSSEVKSKLSDPSYGGHFYEFAQSFVNLEGSYDLPEWLPVYMLVMVPNYPDWPRYWKAEVSYSLRTNAETDFKRVLAGEDLGGGGSDSPVGSFPEGDYYHIPVYANGVLPIPISPNSSNFTPSNFTVDDIYLSVETYNRLVSLCPTGYKFWVIHLLWQNGSNIQYTWGYAMSDRFYLNDSNYLTYDNIRGINGLSRVNVTDDEGKVHQLIFFGDGVSVSNSFPLSKNLFRQPVFYLPITSDTPVVHLPYDGPNGDWPEPETPVTPTAPEQPTPTAPTVTPDPTITEPTPTWPDVTININPDPTVSVTPTGLDYTELLTRINDNLNTINSYSVSINSNLNSLRSDLVTEFESVEQGLKNIYQYLQHFDNLLERHCKHLRDALDDGIYHLELYLKQLFEWLPQQLNFDANFDYDDSSIQTLLRRILTKIPGTSSGLPNDTMPNPVADEPGFFDWLSDLWHRFLIDLVSVLPDELGGLVDAFSQLTHYFPFSIPWDLAALLALFEHEPVTPEFDVPWGFGGGDGEVEMVHIDLSPWDGVMQMVRPVFVVGFCWQLAMITKDLLSGFDINKGGV